MSVTLENWGQLKLAVTSGSVDKDKNNGDSVSKTGKEFDKNEAHSGVKDENKENKNESEKVVTSVQLLSLPKSRDRGHVIHLPKPIVDIPIASIASATATTKNDLTLNLKSRSCLSRHKNSDVELTSVRFAIPNVCVGYEQTEEAGKVILKEVQNEMQSYQLRLLHRDEKVSALSATGKERELGDKLLLMATASLNEDKHEDEVIVAIFDDVMISYPSGKYKIAVSNYNVILEDKRRGVVGGVVTFPLSNIQQLYLCDVPSHFAKAGPGADDLLAQYVVLILRTPLKIRASTYNNVVISCPPYLVLDDAHAWKCELTSQEEINKTLQWNDTSYETSAGNENTDLSTESKTSDVNKATKDDSKSEYPLTPTMSGRVSEILVRVFKALAKVPAFGGVNKEYRSLLTQSRHCCLRCLFRGAEGLLYIVNGGLLFLHRPATKLAFSTIQEIEMDEAESGSATFQLSVFTKPDVGRIGEKYVFSGIDKIEKDNLLQYLGKKVKLVRHGIFVDDNDDNNDDDDDDDDDKEEEEDEDEEEEDDDNSSVSFNSEDSDGDDSEHDENRHRGNRKRPRHSKDETNSDKSKLHEENESKKVENKSKRHHSQRKKTHGTHKHSRKEETKGENNEKSKKALSVEEQQEDKNKDSKNCHHKHRHHHHTSHRSDEKQNDE